MATSTRPALRGTRWRRGVPEAASSAGGRHDTHFAAVREAAGHHGSLEPSEAPGPACKLPAEAVEALVWFKAHLPDAYLEECCSFLKACFDPDVPTANETLISRCD